MSSPDQVPSCSLRPTSWPVPPAGRGSRSSLILLLSLPEACRATAHDFALADQLGVELASVESEKDIEVDTCVGSVSETVLV